MYNLTSTTMNLNASSMDSFYRLFLIPGMHHCLGGPGAWRFGQYDGTSVALGAERNNSAHNVLLALVDWVEGGAAPERVVGTVDDGSAERVHCKYPARSGWDAKLGWWVCKD